MDASELIQVRVGRSDQNDLTIPHPSVSSQHCTISFVDGRWIIEDAKSTNGTFVNGIRISHHVLNKGDRVLLGLVAFRFADGDLKLESTHSESLAQSQIDLDLTKRDLSPRVIILTSLLLVGLVAVIVLLVRGPEEPETTTPEQASATEVIDLFTQPPDLSRIIGDVRGSIFGIECGGSGGTGWSLRTGDSQLIITNHHVVAECLGASSPRIVVDGTESVATIVNSDDSTDLAVLKTSRQLTGLSTASPPPVGSWLMVIGNPIGLDRSINYGTLTNTYEGLLITDAAINPGNSGGPVFNSRGEVIGVASAKLVVDGIDRIGLVIPLSELCVQVLDCQVGQWSQ